MTATVTHVAKGGKLTRAEYEDSNSHQILDAGVAVTLLTTGDVDDTPVNGETTAPISSNWAYDHVAAADPHTGYLKESDLDDTAGGTNGATTKAATSNIVYDHGVATTGVHGVGAGTIAKTSDITATKLDDFAAPDDNTDLNASDTKHGLVVKATAPASGLINVVGIGNGETAYTNKALFDATSPSTQAFGDSAATGTATVSARRDHKHAMPSVASSSDINTGTDNVKAVTADGFAGSVYGKRVIEVQVFDAATAVATGDGKAYLIIPSELNGYNLVDADAGVITVSSSGTPTVQIYNLTQTADMLSTLITVDANEYTSYTAAAAPAIDANNDDVATGDILRIDVDVAGTGTKGLIVILSFQLP